MNKKIYIIAAIITSLLSGCNIIGGIFEAGYNLGTFTILAILVIIVGIYYYLRKR